MQTLSSGARSQGRAFRCPISVTLKMTVEITVMRVTVVRRCSWEGLHAAHRVVLVDGVGFSREFLMDHLGLSISHLHGYLYPHIRGPVTSLLCSVFVEPLLCL